jgi:hypothetical protein
MYYQLMRYHYLLQRHVKDKVHCLNLQNYKRINNYMQCISVI